MADAENVQLSEQHAPQPRAVEAFTILKPKIAEAIIASRHHWDKHEPRMWSKTSGVSDSDLVSFDPSTDLVAVRAASVSYGTIIIGKIRLPSLPSPGFVHVRIHDPADAEKSEKDVVFHSLYTEEGNKDADGRATTYRAILDESDPIEFFNE